MAAAFGVVTIPTCSRNVSTARGPIKVPRTVARFQAEAKVQVPHQASQLAPLITEDAVEHLEGLLSNGESMVALRRFNDALLRLTADNWQEKLRPVFNELCFNLESFNPAFTAVLLKVQSSIGTSDYVRRDNALRNLIVPLAGEYGMHNGEEQTKTHRVLFGEWYESMFGHSLESMLQEMERPLYGPLLFEQMMRDINGGGNNPDPMTQAVYAMGYNLAIEYMADYEKTWMLDSFRQMDCKYMSAQGRKVDWVFLEVHAEDEKEHAAIGHAAVLSFVPANMQGTLRMAMADHDRDFAYFYNRIADMLD